MINDEIYQKYKESVELLEEYIELSKVSRKEKMFFRNQILVLKIGGKIPLNYFDTRGDLAVFIMNNILDRILFKVKFALKYDVVNGLLFPVELSKDTVSWFSWKNLTWTKEVLGFSVKSKNLLLFKTDEDKKLTKDFSFLLYGITKYNKITSANFRPFMHLREEEGQEKYYLDIKTNWGMKKKASYIWRTHVYLELTDAYGYVRSVGQDIFESLKEKPVYGLFRARVSSSILKTPDESSFCYTHLDRKTERIRIEISKKEHDRIIALVERDKYNHQRTAEPLKGNCSSYVSRVLLMGVDYAVNTEVHGFEILSREFFSSRIDKCIAWFSSRLSSKPEWLQRAVFCFPPIYALSFIMGIVVILFSTFGFKNHREYSMWELLFKPWKIKCDIPLVMYRVLLKYVNENGEILRGRYPPGTIFD